MMKDKKLSLIYAAILASSVGVSLNTLIVPFITDTMTNLTE